MFVVKEIIYMFNFHGWPAPQNTLTTNISQLTVVHSVLTWMAGKCGLVDGELLHSEIWHTL